MEKKKFEQYNRRCGVLRVRNLVPHIVFHNHGYHGGFEVVSVVKMTTRSHTVFDSNNEVGRPRTHESDKKSAN